MEDTAASEVGQLVQAEQWDAAADRISDWPPPAVADLLCGLSPEERFTLFRLVPPVLAPQVLAHLTEHDQQEILESLPKEHTIRLLEQVDPDDRTHILERLSPEDLEEVLAALNAEVRREATQLLSYPEGSIGRLMSTRYVAVREDWTIADALAHVRVHAHGPDSIGTIYVTDDHFQLIDMLELSRFVLAPPDGRVSDIMDRNVAWLSPENDREEAVRTMLKHDVVALPVVNDRREPIGVITFDDVMDIAEEEATEDIQRLAGVEPLGVAYPDVGMWPLFQKRIPWLATLIFVYLGASAVISNFEAALSAHLVLAAFIPLLMGTGGNVGAQSGTLTVRAMATEDLVASMWLRALTKELAVGAALGIALGVLAGIIAYWRGGSQVALVIATSMVLIVISANCFGTLLPMLLNKIGVDPAVASNPMITSVTDLTSVSIYLLIASRVLPI